MHIQAQPTLEAARSLLTEAGLPTDDLSVRLLANFFFVGDAAAPDGVVGLEFCGGQALIRSLAVRPAARGRGLGAALVRHAEQRARQRGIATLYLLTDTAETFFAARGYLRVARDRAPEPIRQSRQFSALCPASAILMAKSLTPGTRSST